MSVRVEYTKKERLNMEFDYKRNIKEIRREFYENKTVKYKPFKKPMRWDKRDPLMQIYNDTDSLMNNGKVVYASLVQANSILFKRFPPIDCPACVLFSLDEHYDSNPQDLTAIADEIYRYKGTSAAPAEIKRLVDVITDEISSLFNHKLPESLTGGRTVYYTTIMVQRNHLYKNRILDSLFPLVCDPDKFKTSVILPKDFLL